MNVRRIAIFGLLLLLSLVLPRRADATALLLNNSWLALDDFSETGSLPLWFTGVANNPGGFTGIAGSTAAEATAYTWNSASWVRFDITDWLVVGDGFNVFDNGVFVATFSGKPGYTALSGCGNGLFTLACHWTGDPDTAFLDPVFNQGTLMFAPGPHSVTIADIAPPAGYPDGTVAFRAAPVATAVPEPASLFLLGCGLIAAATRLRRRGRS